MQNQWLKPIVTNFIMLLPTLLQSHRWASGASFAAGQRSQCALTAAVGAALVLEFAPWSWGALAPLPMAVLFYQTRSESVSQTLARGYVFGLGLFGVGIA